MDRAVREMTFEKEAAFYREEARAVFAKEDPTCEASEVNNILRRGMRIIRKAEERIAAMQESKRGRWIPLEYDGYADGFPVWNLWECSRCQEEHSGDEDTLTPYCPNCGAKMEVDNGLDQH